MTGGRGRGGRGHGSCEEGGEQRCSKTGGRVPAFTAIPSVFVCPGTWVEKVVEKGRRGEGEKKEEEKRRREGRREGKRREEGKRKGERKGDETRGEKRGEV